MGIFLLVIGLLLFIGLVIIHEMGHFFAARRGGVDVEEFGIFFPPRLYKKRTKGGWDFTVNLLPLGGFVKLKGEHDSDTGKGAYGAAPTWTKVKIMLAGVFMNLITALVLFTALGWLGTPVLVCNQYSIKNDTHYTKNTSQIKVASVEQGSPASSFGIQPGDTIKAVGSDSTHLQSIAPACDLSGTTAKYAGKQFAVQYVHGGKTVTETARLRTAAVVEASQRTNKPVGYLGIATEASGFAIQRSTWSAPITAVGLSVQLTALTFQGLGHAVAGLGGIIAGAFTNNHVARENAQTSASSQVSGPVGIFVILKDGSLLGYQFMLMIIAVISLTLAIMNVLPIPALDGGRLFVMLISRLLKKRISPGAEEAIYGTGFAVLMLLIIIISIVDVKRFF